jgi:hypothetical protein
MPGDVGARVAMQQQHRGIGTAVPDAQHRLADVDALQRETLEDEGLGTSDADQ